MFPANFCSAYSAAARTLVVVLEAKPSNLRRSDLGKNCPFVSQRLSTSRIKRTTRRRKNPSPSRLPPPSESRKAIVSIHRYRQKAVQKSLSLHWGLGGSSRKVPYLFCKVANVVTSGVADEKPVGNRGTLCRLVHGNSETPDDADQVRDTFTSRIGGAVHLARTTQQCGPTQALGIRAPRDCEATTLRGNRTIRANDQEQQ